MSIISNVFRFNMQVIIIRFHKPCDNKVDFDSDLYLAKSFLNRKNPVWHFRMALIRLLFSFLHTLLSVILENEFLKTFLVAKVIHMDNVRPPSLSQGPFSLSSALTHCGPEGIHAVRLTGRLNPSVLFLFPSLSFSFSPPFYSYWSSTTLLPAQYSCTLPLRLDIMTVG